MFGDPLHRFLVTLPNKMRVCKMVVYWVKIFYPITRGASGCDCGTAVGFTYLSVSVLQHGPRVSLGCRSNEFLDHAKT
jgi:hypothetical protein